MLLSSLPLAQVMEQADALSQQGAPEQAIVLYQNWLLNQKDPLRFVALFNMAALMAALGRSTEAQNAYREALQQNPHFFQARLNLGSQLEREGRIEGAIAEWKRALLDVEKIEPSNEEIKLHALNNLARVLENERRYDEAEAYMLESLEVNPDQGPVLHHYIHLRQKQCKWPVYADLNRAPVNQQLVATSALAMLAIYDDPGLQLLAAREFIHYKVNPPAPRKKPRQRKPGEKIRLGYISGDLCMHAVGLLTVELFELHNKDKFELFAFCWSRDDGSPLRERIINAFDHHIRIGALDDATAAQVIAAHEIDILVDLQGLTSGARPNILAQRPAPIQVSYLGFPGTSGLQTIDYIIADPFVFPKELEHFMVEKPLRVPRCYQVSDRQRAVGKPLTRADCGLPEDKFVFASFNNNYKFTEDVFATWMKILAQVPESVLWLLADNRWAQKNMENAAIAHGVDPARIIFSGRAMPEEYMSRLRLPDLFLDTFPYNAGTTANDILWMGTPILTYSGKTYISRMCGSLLTAVGLSELIAFDLAEYENKAVCIGNNRRKTAAYKIYLDKFRLGSDLFNMPALVQDIEDAFESLI